jgi:opacity protein-like surface antigen
MFKFACLRGAAAGVVATAAAVAFNAHGANAQPGVPQFIQALTEPGVCWAPEFLHKETHTWEIYTSRSNVRDGNAVLDYLPRYTSEGFSISASPDGRTILIRDPEKHLVAKYRRWPCPPPRTSTVGPSPALHSFAGILIGKEWAGDRWVPFGQESLGGADVPTATGTDISKDPVRVQILYGVDKSIGSYGGLPWIAGAEFGASFGNTTPSAQRIPGTWGPGGIVAATPALNDSISVSQRWDIDALGRIGLYAMPGTLVFAAAGVDFRDIRASFNCTLAGACGAVGVAESASTSSMQAGLLVGGGVDFSLASLGLGSAWNGRVEYLHGFFGNDAYQIGNAATFLTKANIQPSTDTIWVGATYSFSGPSAPATEPPSPAVHK